MTDTVVGPTRATTLPATQPEQTAVAFEEDSAAAESHEVTASRTSRRETASKFFKAFVEEIEKTIGRIEKRLGNIIKEKKPVSKPTQPTLPTEPTDPTEPTQPSLPIPTNPTIPGGGKTPTTQEKVHINAAPSLTSVTSNSDNESVQPVEPQQIPARKLLANDGDNAEDWLSTAGSAVPKPRH